MKAPKGETDDAKLTLEEAREEIGRLRKAAVDNAAEYGRMMGEASELKGKVNALFDERNSLKLRLEKVDASRPPEELTKEVRGLRKEVSAKDILVESLRREGEKAEARIKEMAAAARALEQRYANLEANFHMIQQARDQAQSDRNAALARLGIEEQGRKDAEARAKGLEAELSQARGISSGKGA